MELLTDEEIAGQQPYAYWLDGVKGLGNGKKQKLLSHFQRPEEICLAEREVLSPFLTGEQIQALKEEKRRMEEYYELSGKGICFYPYYHPCYPQRLREIPDKPFGLYVKGELPKEEERSLAIVGARNCSEYGRYLAEAFGGELGARGVQIISGFAKGVDGLAQAAALEAGGSSFGVLGCGVDVCYPASHAGLYEQILRNGGLLSPYPPGTPPLSFHFPPRNRIISGLADAVLVIEAREKSGTLITVDMALEQGREVYVIPGRVTDRLSDGCNRLLQQGAGVALSPAQLFAELEESLWRDKKSYPLKAGKAGGVEAPGQNAPKGKEEALLALLEIMPLSLDEIRLKMKENKLLRDISLPDTLELLLKLVLKGCARQTGGCYARVGKAGEYGHR